MTSSGQLVYAVASQGTEYQIRSSWSYNDGGWHHVAATLDPDRMTLYVDGVKVADNPITPAKPYPGFWRVGGDNLQRWAPPSERRSPAPPSYYLQGTADELAAYSYALSAERVAAHYAANTLNH
jgi:hypothetical protein